MIEQGRQRAHDQDQRQCLEGEDEGAGAVARLERDVAAAKIAEHKRRSCHGRLLQRLHDAVEREKQVADRRQFQ